MNAPVVVGVDLGGTKVAAATVSRRGGIGPVHKAPSRALDGPHRVIEQIVDVVRRAADGSPIRAVGIGSAGVIDPVRGVVVDSTDSFTDWPGTPIADLVAGALGTEVSVINDVAAHAIGEAITAEGWSGAGAEFDSFCMIAVGTGVGGALVDNGVVRSGARHVAGHIAHVPVPGAENMRCPCGRYGHVEAISAGPAIERVFAEKSGRPASGAEISREAGAGDALAAAVLRDAAVALARAVAGVVSVWDPAGIVLGGSVPFSGSTWFEAFDTALRAELIAPLADIPVRLAAPGGLAAIVGSAHVTGLLED